MGLCLNVCACARDDCTLLSSFGSRKCLKKLSSQRIRHHSLVFDTFTHSCDALLDIYTILYFIVLLNEDKPINIKVMRTEKNGEL